MCAVKLIILQPNRCMKFWLFGNTYIPILNMNKMKIENIKIFNKFISKSLIL